MFSGVYWNQPVCPSVCPSVYRILVSVKVLQGGIKSQLKLQNIKFTESLDPGSDFKVCSLVLAPQV